MYELGRGAHEGCANKRGLVVLAAIGNVSQVCRKEGDGLVSFYPACSLHTSTCFIHLYLSALLF